MGNKISIGSAFKDQDLDGSTITNATITNSTLTGAALTGAVTATTLTASGNVTLGDNAADTIGMYGVTPVVQRATAASHTVIATTVTVSTTSAIWGFSTSTQGNALIAAVAEIQATLLGMGTWAA